MFFAKKLSYLVAAAVLVMMSACGSGGDSDSSAGGTGTTGGGGSGAGNSSVVVSWSAPTQNVDGSALADLDGYTLYYGVDADNLTDSVSVDASSTSYTMNGLVSGTTYYFAVAARNTAGAESDKSEVVNTTV